MPSQLFAFDKLAHAVAFAVGGISLGLALRQTTRWRGAWLFAAIVAGIGLFGAFDELHQLYTPGRTGADIYDWVADMIGGSVAAFVYCWLHGRDLPPSPGSTGADRSAP